MGLADCDYSAAIPTDGLSAVRAALIRVAEARNVDVRVLPPPSPPLPLLRPSVS